MFPTCLLYTSFELVAITSNADAGQPLSSVYPGFAGVSDLLFTTHDAPELKRDVYKRQGRDIRFIASSARAEGHLMWPSCEQDCPSRNPYAPPLRSHTGGIAKLSPGIQKI